MTCGSRQSLLIVKPDFYFCVYLVCLLRSCFADRLANQFMACPKSKSPSSSLLWLFCGLIIDNQGSKGVRVVVAAAATTVAGEGGS